MAWEALKDRAASLRRAADDLRKRAEEHARALPELALAAEEGRDGGMRAFDEACAEADQLLAQSRQTGFAAVALDERAEEARKEDAEYERRARMGEMSDARAGYDYAVREMDRALKDVEDAHLVLADARRDYVASLRLAGFADAASALTRRASYMLQAAAWAGAPALAKALGVERRHFHRAQEMADAAGFLPEKQKDEEESR